MKELRRIIEDGNGLTDATSYVGIVYADDYFSARGESKWAELSDEEKEYALVKGTDFVDNSFDWYGKKATKEQSLKFPRLGIVVDGYEETGIPKVLKDAVCEASLKIAGGTQMYQESSENGAVTSEHIGQLSFTYDVSQLKKDVTLYDSINLRLRGLFKDKSKQTIYAIDVQRVI